MANFRLVLPVALIEDLDLVLQEDQRRWLTNPGGLYTAPRIPGGFLVFLIGLPGILQESCLSHCLLNGWGFLANSWQIPGGILQESW